MTTQSSGGLFGSSTTTQPQSGGLFGSNQQQQSGGFGATATPFGQQPNTGATSAFGPSNAFGGSSFGSAAPAQDGTGHTKFQPTTSTDTMMKQGQQSSINTRHQCITCMKEYENKSLEELRCEDYIANRKGIGAVGGGGMFGQQPAATSPAGGGVFGQTTSSSGGLFGQQQNKPMFGTTGIGAATSAAPSFGGFGQSSQAGGGGLFGANKPTGFGAPVATVAPAFGAPTGGFGAATSQPSGGGIFGSTTPAFGTNTTGGFGAATSQPGGMFGATTSQPTAFGTTNTTPGFGGFGAQQPSQNIGLFGANNQNKPSTGFGGFGQPASSAPSAFGTTSGGFSATTSQPGSLFGANNQNKPATGFGGFGQPTSSAPTAFGSSSVGFGVNSGVGLFGANNQNKPAAFSFNTGAVTAPTQSFGGFGTTSNTGLFGGAQSKPGGLFGGTNTFGTTTSGFGGNATGGLSGFGSNTGNGGLNFGVAANTGLTAGQAPPNPVAASIHQQLLTLASSPFGENPLFKPLASDANKRADILKPTNPAAQKALLANSYKVSPHRNVKIRVKPNSSSEKSQIFEGLDDDLLTQGDLFVPRTSVKKLVLRSSGADTIGLSVTEAPEDTQETVDNSLTVGLHEIVQPPMRSDDQAEAANDTIPVDDSFVALNTRKKNASEDPEQVDSAPNTLVASKKLNSAGVSLSRAGYYTLPSVSELTLDSEGQCLVTGFTVGREGYGNIHFPGTMNIAKINMDEIVHIRHKEVIVYPDDNNKPLLGEGLNRPAQVTLDKVWPNDKTNGDAIRSPERLKRMSYEEKLERASSRLGAKFIEYRPETGSWVFRVEHFSKYGLIEDSDEELEVSPLENVKKVKTLEKRLETSTALPTQPPVLDNNAKNIMLSANENITSNNANLIPFGNRGGKQDNDEGSDKEIEMNDSVPAINEKPKSVARSALFGDEPESMSGVGYGVTKPVILKHRVSSISTVSVQPRMIECIANSVLGPPAYVCQGLGGVSMLGTGTGNMSSSFTDTSAIVIQDQATIKVSSAATSLRPRTSKLASYSLHGGYDKWVSLPGQSRKPSDQMTVFVPQHVDTELSLEHSVLGRPPQFTMADIGLTINKGSRAGWSRNWDLVSVGDTRLASGGRVLGNVTFSGLEQSTTGDMGSSQVESLRSWFHVALETSERMESAEAGPMFMAVSSLDTLHSHQAEAARQLDELGQANLQWSEWVSMFSDIWR